jgi:hypothetical protein
LFFRLRAICFSILRALFDSPLFFIPRHPTFFLPGREARGSLRHRRASPVFSHAHRMRALRFHKKESIDSVVRNAVDGFSFRGGG